MKAVWNCFEKKTQRNRSRQTSPHITQKRRVSLTNNEAWLPDIVSDHTTYKLRAAQTAMDRGEGEGGG